MTPEDNTGSQSHKSSLQAVETGGLISPLPFRRRLAQRRAGRVDVSAGQLSFDNLWGETKLGTDRPQTDIPARRPPPSPPVNENRDLMEVERLAYHRRPTSELKQVESALCDHASSATPQEKARLFVLRLIMAERAEKERQRRSRDVLDRWQGRTFS